MADSEFEEFRYYFDRLPQHLKATSNNYTLVHDILLDDESPSSSTTSPRGQTTRTTTTANADDEDEDDEEDNESCHDATIKDGNKSNVVVGKTNRRHSQQQQQQQQQQQRISSGGLLGLGDSEEDEDVSVLLHRHQYHEAHSDHHNGGSADDCDECEQLCYSTIIADSDFSVFSSDRLHRLNNNNNDLNNGSCKTSNNNNSGRDSAIGSSEMGDSCTSSWSSSWATTTTTTSTPEQQQHQQTKQQNNGERRRRRLPEIPKKKSLMTRSAPSLAEELDAAARAAAAAVTAGRPHLMQQIQSKGLRLWPTQAPCSTQQQQDDTSPTDSGHSTAHSPDNGPKSVSPTTGQPHPGMSMLLQSSVVSLGGDSSSGGPLSPQISTPGSSSAAGLLSFPQLELLEATHRGLHKFVPRHRDEIELEIGDPVYVQKEADDLWCEGVNLRTGRQGIFPSAYAVDLDYSDFDPTAPKVKRERFLLGYLGSVETQAHKGTSVVCQAVRRIVGSSGPQPQGCVLEISDQGLRMLDRSGGKQQSRLTGAGGNSCHDYFYSLKNVSFCAFHPRDHRYLGFITKHPTLQRFACHVFVGQESTRPVAEAVGRAFHRFYTKFVETAFPIEDIYIE